jgi:hypothetical protein
MRKRFQESGIVSTAIDLILRWNRSDTVQTTTIHNGFDGTHP